MPTKYLTTAEACDLLRCTDRTLRRYAREFGWDKIRPTRRKVLYVRSQIEEHLAKHTYTTA